MTGLRLTRPVRARHTLSLGDVPGQTAEIRRLLATLQAGPVEAPALAEVHAGQLQAAWLISAAISLVIDKYEADVGSDVFARGLVALNDALGRGTVETVLAAYAEAFDAELGPVEALREVLFTWIANVNPAFAPMRDLFDDSPLRATDAYERMITSLASYFAQQPHFGPDHQALVAMLRSPAVAFPDSLSGQLAYIRERWGMLLGELLERLLMGMDLLNEEERAMWLRFHGQDAVAGRPGATMPVYNFSAYQGEREAFTPDREWHPRLVLLAKSVYVWLDQLSKGYGRPIQRLDQIPDEELDRLAAWGITGLWLIGIWQRSRASEQIKRIRGNPEAAASAYALDDYRVADELGGEGAWTNLSERAGQRGLKLAADMVPNHMGLDSSWVIEHPEWFVSLSEPPYPGYSYNGPELSPDPSVSIKIEDHYWDGTDAAVVFRRQDLRSGDTRFVYHGNDGTVMPWNDTAQLNYIDGNVREQVIQTILAVARRFPVIRFDAAMVLTRQHMRRLWWPEPGSGGAIPSRAERSISPAAFDQAAPGEFWREVVDRVAAEGLDTLLLAEAFWLLEGYFVRTLGMHRVYNSAFMHMFRDERNAEYHLVMRNTLEFDPEVLKRFVNFMSNPDEDTAVEQFAKGDKYFGICTMLATLPGLPMFGHGQVEGFAEKYGMEYRRAYHEESVDEELVARHEREIFPLLQRRSQFAEVRDFSLYEFVGDAGSVDENVFAYSNGRGAERSLIIYHNTYAETAGSIRQSVQFMVREGDNRYVTRRSLAEGLGLSGDPDNLYVTFRDLVGQLEYVRPARQFQEEGIWVSLGAYQRNVFLDFAEVYDSQGLWRRLHERLQRRGVPSLATALDELVLESVQGPFRRMVNPEVVRVLVEAASSSAHAPSAARNEKLDQLIEAASLEARSLAIAAVDLSGGTITTVENEAAAAVERALRAAGAALAERSAGSTVSPMVAGSLLALAAARSIGGAGLGSEARSRYLEDWRLIPLITTLFRDLGADEGRAIESTEAVRANLTSVVQGSRPPAPPAEEARATVQGWLADERTRRAMGLNSYEGVTWFGAEAFANLVEVTAAAKAMQILEGEEPDRARTSLRRLREVADALTAMGERAGYRVDALEQSARPPEKALSAAGAARSPRRSSERAAGGKAAGEEPAREQSAGKKAANPEETKPRPTSAKRPRRKD